MFGNGIIRLVACGGDALPNIITKACGGPTLSNFC